MQTSSRHVVHLIAGARPNFMKVAPLFHALKKESWCSPLLVHTGQHYDANMSDAFFSDLALPPPDYCLDVGSGTHAEQTAGVMIAYEQICCRDRPDWVVVVGDVNSTLACALVATKLCIPLAHLEAGLRSRDRTMPEEINRIVTDAISDVLWTPSPDGDDNLRAEGIADSRIERVGNIMIDAFELQRDRIERLKFREAFKLEPQRFGLVTLHRPSNVDDKAVLGPIVRGLVEVSDRLPLIFAVHPRTRRKLEEFELLNNLEGAAGMCLMEPLGYLEFMSLLCDAMLLITDSGGIQEETTYLNIPCLTLREATERPITITQGTNQLIRAGGLRNAVTDILAGNLPKAQCPEFWDGHTATRVVASLKSHIETRAWPSQR